MEHVSEELYRSIRCRRFHLAMFLIMEGYDINLPINDHGATLLHLYVHEGNTEIVLFLLRHKANINAKNEKGNTPLHLAARQGYIDMVKLLVDNGADVFARSCHNKTPVECADVCARKVIRYLTERSKVSVGKKK